MNNLMSDQIDQLATALSKAQGEMEVAYKNQKNPFFKSNYADFEAIISASRPSLAKHGLSVAQPPIVEQDGNSYLVTILMHSSGQWIQSVARHNPPKPDIQSLSSYNTYLKRMCYASLIGVATSDDDDGNDASSVHTSHTSSKYEVITTDQLEQLEDTLKGHADICQDVLKVLKIDSLKEMPKNKFLSSLKQIREIIAAK